MHLSLGHLELLPMDERKVQVSRTANEGQIRNRKLKLQEPIGQRQKKTTTEEVTREENEKSSHVNC